MWKRVGVLLTVTALAATAACATPEDDETSSSPDEPYRIVHLLGMNQTGPAALNAQAAAQAAKAAVAVLNERGGILGRRVELEIIETNGDPTTAVTKLNERLSKGPKPALVLPGNTSAEALPMAPILTEAKILSVQQAGSSALNDPQKFPYLFQVVPTNDSMAARVVEFFKERNATRIAMLAGKDAFGQATAEATRKAIASAGLTLTGDETYTAEYARFT